MWFRCVAADIPKSESAREAFGSRNLKAEPICISSRKLINAFLVMRTFHEGRDDSGQAHAERPFLLKHVEPTSRLNEPEGIPSGQLGDNIEV